MLLNLPLEGLIFNISRGNSGGILMSAVFSVARVVENIYRINC